jgi:hypothetical protein
MLKINDFYQDLTWLRFRTTNQQIRYALGYTDEIDSYLLYSLIYPANIEKFAYNTNTKQLKISYGSKL